MNQCDMILAGTGGQGVLLFAKVLGEAAVNEGYNVRVSEIHGMAQRGGAVVSHIRIGEKATSPTVLEGTADIIVGLEPIEALRNIRLANEKTLVLTNTTIVKPSGIPQNASYPQLESILQKIRLFTKNILVIDAQSIAKSLGNANVLNIAMLGALFATGKLPVKRETIQSSIKDSVSQKFLEINLNAFEAGYKEISSRR
jgi:indolepyruvate ferredoxin oxidoreductase beta subunit